MKVAKLKIIKFRNLADIEIDFEPVLNAIAGQNGTSKTSILGLVGHVFNFAEQKKSIFGKRFATQFSEIFKFAYPDYDKAGSHIWEVELDDGRKIPALSYSRKERFKKETIRIRVGKSKTGSGKVHLPVIYLGMGRLFPLALEKNIKSYDSVLLQEEIDEFRTLHNEILLMDHEVVPEAIESSNKKFFAVSTNSYNHLGNSAGQDNVGQIITALISFKRLQKDIGEKYQGGIMLIDEIDASLFPAAQIKLIEKLYKKSLELNLQIFFTTHSLEILSATHKAKDSKIIFLDKSYGKIRPVYNLNPEELSRELLVLGPTKESILNKKRSVYCEDSEAVDFLRNILDADTLKMISIFSAKLSNNELKEIAKKKIPDLKNSLIVLDGDTKNCSIENVFILPGGCGPDQLIYKLLKSFPEEHKFWKTKKGYTKQFCFKDFPSRPGRKDFKKWYKDQRVYWGRNAKNAWKEWMELNKRDTDKFAIGLKKMI